jgi:subtilase family serine protease
MVATIAILALSACGGGNSSSSSLGGNLPQTQQPVSIAPPSITGTTTVAYSGYPASAPAGVRVYVHLPLRNVAQLDQLISQQSDRNSPQYHQFLTPDQFRAQFGPTGSDLQSAAAAMKAQGFTVAITSQGLVADAPQATVERTFGIHLNRGRSPLARSSATTLLQSDRAPTLPAALAKVNAQVAAFASLPPARPQFLKSQAAFVSNNRYGATGPYFFDDLKQAYQYPSFTRANGAGRTIAILAASDFLDSDVSLYFGYEGLTPPTIIRRPVDGGSPPFDINNGVSDEVSLDVQQSGGSAPGATIIVYEAPDASITPSFIDMYTAIVEDNKADVASASFGLCELYFTAAYNGGQDFTYLFQAFHDVFRQGNAQGITFVNSSGDNGALGCTDTSGATATYGVEWPANDPDVTGVGGTNLVTTSGTKPYPNNSAYVSENADNDPFAADSGEPAGAIFGSGGGKSVYWNRPLFQYLVNTGASRRTVPDIAMHMGGCPVGSVQPCGPNRSSDVTALGGGFYLLIGTSASAPEFAGLQAVQDEVLGGRAGNANYLIYLLAAIGSVGNGPVFHSNIPGNNGYPTHPGYNFVLGNGTPHAAQYALDPFGPFAGVPQTPSNP